MFKLLTTMSLAALFVGLPFASAQTPPDGAERLFTQLDADRDGKLSQAEFTAHPDLTAEMFSSYDSDGDKSVSKAEFVAAFGN